MPVSSKVLDAVFGAMSHASRRQILIVLHARGGTMHAGEIADRFKHSWPTTTRHLGVLENAGLLKVSRDGRNRVYTLQTGPALKVAEWICGWAAAEITEFPAELKKLSYSKMRNAVPPGDSGGGGARKSARKSSGRKGKS